MLYTTCALGSSLGRRERIQRRQRVSGARYEYRRDGETAEARTDEHRFHKVGTEAAPPVILDRGLRRCWDYIVATDDAELLVPIKADIIEGAGCKVAHDGSPCADCETLDGADELHTVTHTERWCCGRHGLTLPCMSRVTLLKRASPHFSGIGANGEQIRPKSERPCQMCGIVDSVTSSCWRWGVRPLVCATERWHS
jgi:hypothetical protein